MVIKVKSGRERRDGQLSKVVREGMVSKVKSGGERRDGQ